MTWRAGPTALSAFLRFVTQPFRAGLTCRAYGAGLEGESRFAVVLFARVVREGDGDEEGGGVGRVLSGE